MITEQEKTILKNFVYSREWKMLEKLRSLIEQQIIMRSRVADTEWETVKNTLISEGEIQGMKRLMQEVIEQANQSK